MKSGDTISREETLTAFADYVGSGMLTLVTDC